MNTNTNADNDLHSNDLTQLSSREQLSALMDGALPADQTRFLLRRLQHDESLAECWERWRLTGETMRGLAPAQRLPADFASRVSAALHGADADVAPVAVNTGGRRMPAWLRWGGGAAMAASLAMVAMIVRQPSDDPETSVPAVQVAANVTPPVPAGSADPIIETVPPAAEAPVLVAAAAVATTRPMREQATSAARRDRRQATAPRMLAAVQSQQSAVAASTEQLPVQAPQPDIVTRPWPRSVLPQYANGGLAVGFGDNARQAQAYNPFQQSRLVMVPVADDDAANAPAQTDRAADADTGESGDAAATEQP